MDRNSDLQRRIDADDDKRHRNSDRGTRTDSHAHPNAYADSWESLGCFASAIASRDGGCSLFSAACSNGRDGPLHLAGNWRGHSERDDAFAIGFAEWNNSVHL